MRDGENPAGDSCVRLLEVNMYDNLEKEFDRKQIDIVRRELTAKNKRLPTYIELLAELYLRQGPQSNKPNTPDPLKR